MEPTQVTTMKYYSSKFFFQNSSKGELSRIEPSFCKGRNLFNSGCQPSNDSNINLATNLALPSLWHRTLGDRHERRTFSAVFHPLTKLHILRINNNKLGRDWQNSKHEAWSTAWNVKHVMAHVQRRNTCSLFPPKVSTPVTD
eukprot:5833048-Amphidinium_carterae.1